MQKSQTQLEHIECCCRPLNVGTGDEYLRNQHIQVTKRRSRVTELNSLREERVRTPTTHTIWRLCDSGGHRAALLVPGSLTLKGLFFTGAPMSPLKCLGRIAFLSLSLSLSLCIVSLTSLWGVDAFSPTSTPDGETEVYRPMLCEEQVMRLRNIA